MDRCPKDEPTGKNLVCRKALLISEKNWKNFFCGGGGGVASTPLGHRRVKTQLFFSYDPSMVFRTLGLCSNNGKSCFDKFQMAKSQNDFFKTESGKFREGLNRPNNFEVFSKLIIQVLFCGEKLIGILLMVVMK